MPEPAAATPGRSDRLYHGLRRIGPGIVVAAVVLGPGSIVSASRVGCQYGYDLLWVVPMASVMMISMTMTSMAVGALDHRTPCQAVAESFGRPVAWLVGLAMLVAITMFQASNNNAMLMSAEGFFPQQVEPDVEPDNDLRSSLFRSGIPLAFNLVIIGILWASRRDLYRLVERWMAWLVGAMVLAFTINLIFARPALLDLLAGLIPQLPADQLDGSNPTSGNQHVGWMTAGAMVATTFSVAGAFYQSYQVREKGWSRNDLAVGRLDSLVGIGALGLITMMILVTGAASLHGVVPAESLTDAAAVAQALEPLFGSASRYVFAAGVLAGAVSSFVVNALIGAVVFCDSIGKSTKLADPPVRWTTVGVLMLGWLVASIGVWTNIPLADFIIVAQSLTVIAFPVLAITIIWQCRTLPRDALPFWVRPLNYAGLFVTLGLSARTILRLMS